jgi:hypothetical protein
MEHRSLPGVSRPCLTFQSIRSFVLARAHRLYCDARPKLLTLFARQHSPDRAWQDLLRSFEAARDEWTAMEAVVHLELVLEAAGLLIEERTAHPFGSSHNQSRAA